MYNRRSIFFLAAGGFLVTIVAAGAIYLSRTTTSTASFAKTDREGSLVSGFPQVPVYPGSIIEDSYVKSEGDLLGFEANWTVAGNVYQITNWYLAALPAEGWVIKTAPQEPRGEEVSEEYAVFEKDNRELVLVVENEERTDAAIHIEFPMRRQ